MKWVNVQPATITLVYTTLLIGGMVLVGVTFAAQEPAPPIDGGAVDAAPIEEPGTVKMASMSVNGTPTVGSPVNVTVWMTHSGNETKTINRTVELFDEQYDLVTDAKPVTLRLPPNGSDSVTVSLRPPKHSGNYSVGLLTPYGEHLTHKHITVRLIDDPTTDLPEEEYRIPENLSIHRLEPADTRIPRGSNHSLEMNVTNEGDEPIQFDPPVFVYDQQRDVRVSHTPVNVTVGAGETVHREIDIGRVNRSVDPNVWIGIDYDGARMSVGHVEVYEPKGVTSSQATTQNHTEATVRIQQETLSA